jgi:hypothetical protein
MKTREEVAGFINSGSCMKKMWDVKNMWHFGKADLRVLMDFIYEGEPEKETEKIKRIEPK